MSASLAGPNQIVVSWNPSNGASSFDIERSLDASSWSIIATDITATSFTDSNLNYSTSYYYRAFAVSMAGTSAPSLVVGAETGAQADVLTGQALKLSLARRTTFTAPVATFIDANTATTANRFTATIRWGDGETTVGTVTGGDGSFTVWELTGMRNWAFIQSGSP